MHYGTNRNYSFNALRPLLMFSTMDSAKAYVVILAFSGGV